MESILAPNIFSDSLPINIGIFAYLAIFSS